MRNYIKKVGIWLIVLIFTASFLPAVSARAEEEREVLKVAFPEAQGINEIYEDGTYGGIVYDWLTEIAKYTGWEYEFIGSDADSIMSGMMEGEYDLMGGMFYQDSFEEYFNYPKYIMGSNYSLLIYRKNDKDIRNYDYNTLNGKRIGVYVRAESKIKRLEKFLDFNNIKCELVYYDNVEAYENCLDDPQVDIMLGSDVYMSDEYNVAGGFASDPYYLVSSKARPELCEELNEAMEAIYSANANFANELYDKYFPDKYINSVNYTKEEIAFIEKCGIIRVAAVENIYPFSYEQEGSVTGIVNTSLDTIADKTGLKFEYVYARNYQEALNLVIEGKADIFSNFMDSELTAESLGLVRTANYAVMDSVILRNKNNFDTEKGFIMAAPMGRSLKTWYENDTIRYYKNYKEGLNAVNKGEADYIRMPASVAEGMLAGDYYANVVLVGDTNFREEISLAMSAPVDVTLYSILSKAINNFSVEEQMRILNQNSVNVKNNATLKALVYTNPVLAVVICVGIILFFSVVIILINAYRMRAKVMRVRLEKAEEMSKAKSDFLSRMSHEIRTPMNAIIGLTNLTLMSENTPPAVTKNLNQIDASAKFLLSLLNDILDMSKIDNDKMKLMSSPFDLNSVVDRMKSMFAAQAKSKGIQLVFSCNIENSIYTGDEMRLQQILTNLLSNACKFTDVGGRIEFMIEQQGWEEEKAKLYFAVKDSGIGIDEKDVKRIFNVFEQARGSGRGITGTGLGLAISSSLVQAMGGELQVESRPDYGSVFHFTICLPVYNGMLPESIKGKHENLHSLEGISILLAEDNDINAEIAAELLKFQKMSVQRADNGQKALELFAGSPPGTFDIILMDINMPVKDGLTAAAEIRRLPREDAAKIPILAMTANTFQEDRDKAYDSGMNGFLPKPFDVDQLYEILADAIYGRL